MTEVIKDNLKKFKVTVIYGTEASEYADGHTVKGTIRAIKSGKVFGDYKTYEMDTEEDLRTLLYALEDSNGWDTFFWELSKPDSETQSKTIIPL